MHLCGMPMPTSPTKHRQHLLYATPPHLRLAPAGEAGAGVLLSGRLPDRSRLPAGLAPRPQPAVLPGCAVHAGHGLCRWPAAGSAGRRQCVCCRCRRRGPGRAGRCGRRGLGRTHAVCAGCKGAGGQALERGWYCAPWCASSSSSHPRLSVRLDMRSPCLAGHRCQRCLCGRHAARRAAAVLRGCARRRAGPGWADGWRAPQQKIRCWQMLGPGATLLRCCTDPQVQASTPTRRACCKTPGCGGMRQRWWRTPCGGSGGAAGSCGGMGVCSGTLPSTWLLRRPTGASMLPHSALWQRRRARSGHGALGGPRGCSRGAAVDGRRAAGGCGSPQVGTGAAAPGEGLSSKLLGGRVASS